MKQKLSLFFLVLFLSTSVYGQQKQPVGGIAFDTQASDLQAHYWKKHKTFKTLGWTFLLTGFSSLGGGFYGFVATYGNSPSKARDAAFAGVMIGGACLMLASFPMFCLGHSNKLKARSISVGGGNVAAPLPNGSISYQPALSLQWKF